MKKDIDEIINNGINMLLQETYRDKETDGPWYKISSALTNKDLEDSDRLSLLQNCRDRYWKTPEAHSLIESIRYYIIGRGIIFHAEDENPIVQEKITEFWNHEENKMELRQKEIVLRVLRDGECFIRLFNSLAGTIVRFVEPEQIKSIKYNDNDAEKAILYHREWIDGNKEKKTEDIPAENILHIKINTDMDMDRGRPILEPIIKRLIQLEQFIEGRIIKNRIASGFILEKIIHGKGGTSEAVSSVTSGMSDAKIDNQTNNTGVASKKMPKFGSVVVHNDAIEYKWCNPEIKADDCREDARLIKLSICSGVNAPEYLLSDAQNANYASTMVAENPFVRKCEDLQDTFEVYLQLLFKKVIENYIVNGIIPKMSKETILKESFKQKTIFNKIRRVFVKEQATKSIPTKTGVKIEFPPMTHKELLQESQSYQIHSAMGWASDKTLAGKLGYNYDEENEIIQKQQIESPDNKDEEYEQDRKDIIKKEDQDADSKEE